MQKIELHHFVKDKKQQVTYTYWTEGNPHNPPLMLLPGFTGTHGDLIDFARNFRTNYFVIIPDFPGWGNTPQGSYHPTVSGYAEFIHDIVLDTKLKQKVVLVGHCMGAVIAIEFAYQYPEETKSLFLISVPYLHGDITEEVFYHLAQRSKKVPSIFRPLFFFFRSRIFAIPLGFFVIQTRSIKKKLSIIMHNAVKQQFQREDIVERNWNSLVLYDYFKIKRISLPIHIFHGEKDLLIRPIQSQRLSRISPYATISIIHNSGHMPPVETPVSLYHAMEKFL